MTNRVLLSMDLQQGFIGLISGGWPNENEGGRPFEGDQHAWDGPSACLQKAADAGAHVWYAAFILDAPYLYKPGQYKHISSVVGCTTWNEAIGQFKKNGFEGFGPLNRVSNAPVFFKNDATLFGNPDFLAALRKNSVTGLDIIGCDSGVCVAENALHGVQHKLDVRIIQNHVFGSEAGQVPKPQEDRAAMRGDIDAFRASDGWQQQIRKHLYSRASSLRIPDSIAEAVRIITEHQYFAELDQHKATRPGAQQPDHSDHCRR